MIRGSSCIAQRLGCAALMLGTTASGCTSVQPGLSGATQAMPPSQTEQAPAKQAAAIPDSPHGGAFLTAYSGSLPPPGFNDLCSQYAWACHDQQSAISDGETLQIATRVNRQVNTRIRAASDPDLYGVAERWTLPERGAGDCEDYALLKKKLLVEAGLAGSKLALTTVMNRRGEPHAVLVLRLATGDFVLDNLTSVIRPWQQTGYTFLKMQDADEASGWSAVLLGPFASRS